MIVVQTTFQLVPDSRDEVLSLMKNMVRLCRQEHGCLSYEYFQGISDPNQIVLLQEWEDADCLQGHYQTDHMEDFLARLGEFLETPVATRSYVSEDDNTVTAYTTEEAELATSEQTIH